MAAIMGPVRTYSVVLAVVLRHWALNTDPRSLLRYLRTDSRKLQHRN